MTFKAIYRCRMCGEIYCPCITGRTIALRTMFEMSESGNKTSEPSISMSTTHLCKDGSFGLADFVGWENKGGENNSPVGVIIGGDTNETN